MKHGSHDTQAKRQARYGTNVAVAVVAAVVLVVLINWIAERQLRKNLPASAWKWVRYDFTAQRQYSLSPQTLQILGNLKEPVQIVTLLASDSAYDAGQVIDLIDEYGRYSDKLSVDHYNPARDIAQMEIFLKSLRERYSQPLAATEAAVKGGRAALAEARQAGKHQRGLLEQLLKDPSLASADLRKFFQMLVGALLRVDRQFDRQDQLIQQSLDKPLPDFGGALTLLKSLLSTLEENYTISIDQLTQAVGALEMPNSVKDKLLELIESLKVASDQLSKALADLEAAKPVEEYDQLLYSLASAEPIVIVGSKQVRVLQLSDMFRQPDPSEAQSGVRAELRSQAEEKLSGALLSMSIEHPPLVVFLSGGQMAAIGPRGQFNEVAQRLRNLRFDVQQWSPVGQPGPMGQAAPPGPVPQPKPDQKAVWVVVPSGAMGGASPMAAMGDQQVADLLRERLDQGHGALVMLGASSMDIPQADPIADLLRPWSITPQLDRVLLKQAILPDHRAQSFPLIGVETWPTELSVTRALGGMSGLFPQCSPLILADGAKEGVKIWPLVSVSGNDIWSERDFRANPLPELDQATAGGPFVIAAAAENKNSTRMIVVADPGWASDEVTTYGLLGPGTAEAFGARFPANAELFVNSVQWLAGLDQLIAASARSQDIRRVGEISEAGMNGLRWSLYLGMPGVVMCVGLGVWLIRRRSA